MRDFGPGNSLQSGGPAAQRNTLGVRGQAYGYLLEKLDEHPGDNEVNPQRVFTRMTFLEPLIRIVTEGPQGKREMTLACRNLSRGGVGLLHSSFMYPNTQVTVYLPRADGTSPGVRGKVVRIQHRGGVVHEIGIKFDKEINPRDYVSNDITEALPSFERVAPGTLNGNVVFVTASDQIRRDVKQHLLETNLRFRFVTTTEEAVAEAATGPEMMLVDIDLPSLSGPELLKKLRTRGYNNPAALIGDPGNGVNRSLVRVCGADALVRTPLTEDSLLRVLGEFLLSGWDLDHLDKARSRVERTTLVTLCAELGTLGDTLDKQSAAEDRVALFATCQRIAGVSSMIGMNGVASMAERLAEQAAEGNDATAIGQLVEQVRLGCLAAGKAAA